MDRFATKRKNPLERRRDSSAVIKDCAEESCPVAILNHERLDAAFSRLDDERVAAAARFDRLATEVKKVSDMVSDRVKFHIFAWVTGILIVIFSTLLGIVWKHQGETETVSKITTDKIGSLSNENSKKIDVAVTRIDDFLRAHETFQTNNQADIDRMFLKLDEIEKSLKNVEINFSALNAHYSNDKKR